MTSLPTTTYRLPTHLQHCILRSLCHAELHHRLCLNLDLFASGWVAAHACQAVYLYQLPKTREHKFTVLLYMGVGHLCEGVHQTHHVFLGQTRLFREHADELRLCHLCHSVCVSPSVLGRSALFFRGF